MPMPCGGPSTGTPATCNSPLERVSRPATQRRNVLLPHPLGPRMLTKRPCGTSTDTEASASTPAAPG
ncbi:hypothetical protein G6F40_017996 [Rhizopus arrhizus]|nr:hypothetical protein G6F40_017996 [Rhizopus arrhizus]